MIGISASPFLLFALFFFVCSLSFYVCEEEGRYSVLFFGYSLTKIKLLVCLLFVWFL